MRCFWCILLAFCILSCGNKSTGPVIEPEPIPNHEAGDLVIDLPGGAKMAFIWVEPGTLRSETPMRDLFTGEIFYAIGTMEIPNGYYLGKYELTQQQWEKVMLTSHWPRRDEDEDGFPELDYPAYNISWPEARDFAEKLTDLQDDGIYRLPTSDEWEYASRAGATTRYFFGSSSDSLSNYAWWGKNVDSAQIVGTKLPNPWGFYDIYGNVWEWTQSGRGSRINPTRYIKGGSYDTWALDASSTGFVPAATASRSPQLGVRILREGPKVVQP
ncbi:MAG: formylglycine-generating enzyme family protein [Gemmatimonadetes bacterium]|nr:formylglycine-generating enzyme family protein [Gemmatimonadota bacterium]